MVRRAPPPDRKSGDWPSASCAREGEPPRTSPTSHRKIANWLMRRPGVRLTLKRRARGRWARLSHAAPTVPNCALRRWPSHAERCGLSPQGEKRKTWTEFPLMPCGRPVASGPRSSSKRGDPSCCCGRSSRVSLFGFGAAPSSRLVGRSAWRLGDGGGKPRQNTLRWFRTWLPNRQDCLAAGDLAAPIRPRDRRSSPTRGARGVTAGRREASGGQGRWARLRAAWRGQ